MLVDGKKSFEQQKTIKHATKIINTSNTSKTLLDCQKNFPAICSDILLPEESM